MKILWLLNICPPSAAQALGWNYTVREGWVTGALNRFLEAMEDPFVPVLCFPQAPGQELICETKTLHYMNADGSAGNTCKQVRLRGFHEDLAAPDVETPGMEEEFERIFSEEQPDLVHIFGTEFAHAAAAVQAWKHPERTLVGIQGLMAECAEAYLADLPEAEVKKRTFRDILKKDGMPEQQDKFRKRAGFEKLTLAGTANVTGRTAFDRWGTAKINPNLHYYKMNETLRSGFYEGAWSEASCDRYTIFLSQGDYPLKGFHYVLEAMPEILKRFPETKVKVAGNSITGYSTWKEKLKISGYGNYLRKRIRDLGLAEKVEILGSRTEQQMKAEYLSCNVFVCPSSLENSPNSVGEAMLLGVPCVLSAVGGIVDLAEDEVSALYFERGDCTKLAEQICRIFENRQLAEKLSEGAAAKARRTHDGDANYERLLEIYGQILKI